MNRLLFYGLVLPLSKWPLERLYGLSKPLYFLLYHVFRYRRSMVRKQLTTSFPTKSITEIEEVEKGFYRHLTDLMLEAVKGFSITQDEAISRCRLTNPELLESLFAQKRNLILVGGHYNNWELLALALPAQTPYQVKGLYRRLSNTFWDKQIKDSRSKYGLEMLTKSEFKTWIEAPKNAPFAIIFGADQSPTYAKKVHWMNFLNQRTAVAFGTEYYAKKYDLVVLYGAIEKVGRGYYTLTFQLVTDTPQSAAHGKITEAHTQVLEAFIQDDPRFWIWTHARWKRTES